MDTPVEPNQAIGRAKTVLVFGHGPDSQAVLTAFVARSSEHQAPVRLDIRGPVRLARETETHLTTVALPLVARICEGLGLTPGAFELSGVNLGAASSQDIGLDLSGFSADLSIFLAVTSAQLQLPLPQDVVCTGHIASADGDIRMVRNLPLKLDAARRDSTITTFVHPALEADASVPTLAEAEFNRLKAALAPDGGRVKIVAVRDVAELFKSILSEEAVVSAALASGYLGQQLPVPLQSGPVTEVCRFLGSGTEDRYFEVLTAKLWAGDAAAARSLLERWVALWVQRKRYPRGFGKTLRRILQSLPPSLRQGILSGPLVPVSACIQLSQCAADRDFEDVLELYRCITSGAARASGPARAPSKRSPARRRAASSTLAIVLAEISRDRLAATLCLPIDAARASFALDSVTVESPLQAYEVITAFYIHLLRYTERTTAPLTFDQAGPEAHALLERTFARSGGVTAALAEAQAGVQGGLRFILDQMTELFKREAQEKHVLHVLATALDPLDWQARICFMKEFFRRCPDAVPAEMASEPLARFARKHDLIVRAYVNSVDEMKQLLRAM